MKKIKHIIKSNRKFLIIIYIDYFIAIFIFKQIIFNNINIDKFNLRLIRVSQYLFLFNLKFRYKINKFNIIFNVLSRLSQIINFIIIFLNRFEKILDILYNNINLNY